MLKTVESTEMNSKNSSIRAYLRYQLSKVRRVSLTVSSFGVAWSPWTLFHRGPDTTSSVARSGTLYRPRLPSYPAKRGNDLHGFLSPKFGIKLSIEIMSDPQTPIDPAY